MSAFQKPPQMGLLDYGATRAVHDDASALSSYGQAPYMNTPLVPSPMADQASQLSDCVPYLANGDYASSYGDAGSPLLGGESTQMPEVLSYTPQRGCEGTSVFVQFLSPYDLHSSPGTQQVFLVFGSRRCECVPTFMDFQGSSFQYAISADAPLFMYTGSPSFAVPLQVTIDGQPSTTLQVGVYTYEQISSQTPPSDGSRKRRISSFEDDAIAQPNKRLVGPPLSNREPQQDSYPYRETRSASFSPYLQNIPATMNGFMAPYRSAASSPRVSTIQYSAVSANPQSALRAPSPMMPSWSSSYLPVKSDVRNPALSSSYGLRTPKTSTSTSANPPLIRTSTLHQSSNFGQTQSFNPYAIYPSKAVLKLNGDLDSMSEGWSHDELDAKRRLVQFTRFQNGSTIHADFAPVAPEKRAPNSICISCIYWDGKDECFVTSVDTIYLLESLVGVRFTVEEKNRIRRNLEGFRPLTVSKAKSDSEDFFKVIMGFPAPKPRNIEKDVKVFPWKILAHALKKIIGKYSASYSSTAAALPTQMAPNYAIHGTGSDSGTASPQSVSDTAPSSTYGTSMATSAYSPHTDPSMASLTGASDFRTVLPAASQSFSSMSAPSSYPAGACQQQAQYGLSSNGIPAPINKTSPWDLNTLTNSAPAVSAAPSHSCYYMNPMSYPLTDASHGA